MFTSLGCITDGHQSQTDLDSHEFTSLGCITDGSQSQTDLDSHEFTSLGHFIS